MKNYKEINQILIGKDYTLLSSTPIKSAIIDRYEYWVGKDDRIMLEVWKDAECFIFKEVETV